MNIALVRVSTEKQDFDLQINSINEYCTRNKIVLDKTLEIKVSGTIPLEENPCIVEVKQLALEGKVDKLIIYKQDRLSRNAIQVLQLLIFLSELNVEIISTVEGNLNINSNEQELLGYINGFIAQQEVANIRKRIVDKMKVLNKENKYTGQPVPLGYYLKDKQLFIDEDEAIIIKMIFNLYLNGNGGSKIAQILNEKGIRTKNNKLWVGNGVLKILHNPIYKGYKRYGYNPRISNYSKKRKTLKEYKLQKFNPNYQIISEDDWNKAQLLCKQRTNNKGKNTKTFRNDNLLLEGLLFHKICGSKMYIKPHANKKYAPIYYCGRCTKKEIQNNNDQKIFTSSVYEPMIIDAIIEQVRNINIKNLRETILEEYKNKNKEYYLSIENLKKELEKYKKINKNANVELEKYFLGESGLDVEIINNMITNSKKNIENINKKIKNINNDYQNVNISEDKIQILLDNYSTLGNSFDKLNNREKKLLLNEIVEKIYISKEEIEIILKQF